MKTVHKKIIIALALLSVTVFALYYFGLAHYLSLESVKFHAEGFKQGVINNYWRAVCAFIGVCIALIAFSLPITAPMGVLGGFLFGLWPAVLYSMVAIIIGAGCSFLVVRYVLAHAMKNKYGTRLNGFNKRMQRYGYTYLITLQLLTIVPYFIINTLAALAGVPFFMFLLTTCIGSFPIVVIYAFAGKQLYLIESWKDILSKEMLLVLVLLGALALLPMFIQKWRYKKEGSDEGDTF